MNLTSRDTCMPIVAEAREILNKAEKSAKSDKVKYGSVAFILGISKEKIHKS